MVNLTFQIYLSYSQLCVFSSSLSEPFNDWSDRNFTQGFSWRPGSASFRALFEDGIHKINLFINEPVPSIGNNCVRAFRVPFDTTDGHIEIASISESKPIEMPSGKYILQVEFIKLIEGTCPEINVRFNQGISDFSILRADDEILTDGDLDLMANPAV